MASQSIQRLLPLHRLQAVQRLQTVQRLRPVWCHRSTLPACHKRLRFVLMLISLVGVLPGALSGAEDAVTSPSEPDAKQIEFFETNIRPVLVKHCYECHSARSPEAKGGLLIDSSAGLLRGGDSGPAIVKGQPGQSPLMEALRYEGLEMPPAGRLPASVIKDFEHWIERGAVDPRVEDSAPVTAPRQTIDIEAGRQFWAFRPVSNPEPPAVARQDWGISDLDAFVLAKLEERGLQPSPDADRRTLLRRVYFDLIGLPPTPDEIAAFLNDESPTALERVVDQLLQSPHYGVHWGRHWLDVARYADSNGNDFNATFHDAWRYRDYVIDAFNNDMPFDQFIREQIAGDLLAAESDEQRTRQLIATGFLMLGTKMLSERDKEKLSMDVVDEQINTIGQAMLGLTLGCARCHDHKFDPVPTNDYYALAGIFRSTTVLQGESQQYVSTWPRRALPAEPEHVAAVTAYDTTTKELQQAIKTATKQRDELIKEIESLKKNVRSVTVDNSQATFIGNWKSSTFSKLFIGSDYVHDDRSEKGEKFAEFTLTVPISGDYDLQLSYSSATSRANNVPVSVKSADGERQLFWNQQKQPPLEGLWVSLGRLKFDADKPAVVTISTVGTEGYVIVDAVRLVDVATVVDPSVRTGASKDAAVEPPAQASPGSPEMDEAERRLDLKKGELSRLEDVLKTHKEAAPVPLPTAFAVADRDEIADCHICIRGEHKNRGDLVPRGVVQVATQTPLPEFSKSQSGRKELGDWIADPGHPLTARVYVNRIWHHLLGAGLVRSVDNFGQLGDRPSHPELLDRLSSDFVRNGWSTRAMIRQIVLSRVYRMSSAHNEAAWNADPENRLLWRANRRRLPAEALRDAMLRVSGNLDLTPAGSPVAGLGTLVTQNVADEQQYERGESTRRSTYLPIIRSNLPPMLVAFDFADPDLVTGQRPVTNVPAQALLLLNSPFVQSQAESTARRLLPATSDAATAGSTTTDANPGLSADRPSAGELIALAYENVLGRQPGPDELTRAVFFMNEGASSTPAESVSANSEASIPAGSTPLMKRLARLIHTLFASTEFRMIE